MTPNDFKKTAQGRIDEDALNSALDSFTVPAHDHAATMARVMARLGEQKSAAPKIAAPNFYRWSLGGGGVALAAGVMLFWFSPMGAQSIDRFLDQRQAAIEEQAIQEDLMALWEKPADPAVESFLDELFGGAEDEEEGFQAVIGLPG